MFQRREPLSLMRKLREFCWPSMGWKRSLIYIKHRLVRLSDSTHKIAMGLALGVAVSFTPFLGTHFIQAGAVAYFMRANMLAAIIGTFIGNPWTFPVIWWASINFGAFLFSAFGLPADTNLPADIDFSIFLDLLWNEPLRIFLPWTLGGYLLCFFAIPPAYMIFYRIVHGAKIARARARLRRVRKIAREMTEMR